MRRRPPPPEGYEEALKNILKKVEEISSTSERERILNQYGSSSMIKSMVKNLLNIHCDSKRILSNVSRIPKFYHAHYMLKDSLENYESIISQPSFYLEDLNWAILSILISLRDIIDELDKFRFVICQIKENKETEALYRYIATAKKIRKAPSYNGSNMHKVEQFLSNPNDFFREHRSSLCLPEVTKKFDRTFAALVAPSFEGKTQTAFTLRSVNPLYFVVAATDACLEGSLQYIYRPFIKHNRFLCAAAKVDMERLARNSSEGNVNIGVDELASAHSGERFFVLGFFLTIMQQFDQKLRETGQTNLQVNWMSFYANHIASFDCFPVTIQEFIEKSQAISAPFCLFLDEFILDPWAIFVRNLARAVGLTCVVSNTNSSIVNVEIDSELSRNGAIDEGWCLVFRRLNMVDLSALGLNRDADVDPSDSINVQFLDNLRGRFAITPETQALFDELFGSWFLNTRPGLAEYALDTLIQSRASSIEEVLRDVSCNLACQLLTRKERMVVRLHGNFANLGLLTEDAYFEGHDEGFNHIQFMNSHLYYLVNPTGSELDYFLTFAPTADKNPEKLRFIQATFDSDGKVTGFNLKRWLSHLTTFRKDELFTFLGCLFLSLERSPSFILHHATRENMNNAACSICDLPNFNNVLRLSGNRLELSVAMICAVASQYFARTSNLVRVPDSLSVTYYSPFPPIPIYSLKGQDGQSWIKNIVTNCVLGTDFRRITCTFPGPSAASSFNLDLWLKSLKIPFIYGINNYHPWLEKLSDAEFGIFARQYICTTDYASIGGYFECSMTESGASCTQTVAIECKNYKTRATAGKLNKLITKAIRGKNFDARTGSALPSGQSSGLPKLFLVFTDDLPDYSEANHSLQTTCTDNEINLFCMEKESLAILPFDSSWTMYTDPKSVGIVFEIGIIEQK